MIRIELKRILKNYSLYIVLLITLLIVTLDIINNPVIKLNSNDFSDYSNGVFSNLLLYNTNKYSNIFAIILPVIATIVCSDSYAEDIKTGFIKHILIRYDKKKYLIKKYIINFTISGFILIIPLIVNYVLYASLIPSIEPKLFFSSTVIGENSFLPSLFFEHPLLHMNLRILLFFIYGGSFASISLASSIFIKNKYSLVIIPYIVYVVMDIVFSLLDIYKYSPLNFLIHPIKFNGAFILIPLVVNIVSFLLFYIGGIKNEEI